MSLKNFHLLFIILAVIITAGFGLWCFFTEAGSKVTGSWAMGLVSLAAAVGLVIYGVKFLKKLDDEGIE